MAGDEAMDPRTMCRIVKDDLGFTLHKKVRAQLLSAAMKAKRLHRRRLLLRKLCSGTVGPVMWSDEKFFTIEAIHNVQNNCVLGRTQDSIPKNHLIAIRRQKPSSIMVWAGIMSNRKKTPLVFIEEGIKVKQHMYKAMLVDKVLPWLQDTFSDAPYTFCQDVVPSHTA